MQWEMHFKYYFSLCMKVIFKLTNFANASNIARSPNRVHIKWGPSVEDNYEIQKESAQNCDKRYIL